MVAGTCYHVVTLLLTEACICHPVGCVYAAQCQDAYAKQLLSYTTHSFKNWSDIILLRGYLLSVCGQLFFSIFIFMPDLACR